MARGSSFWSTSRGKLGNMVLSTLRGQQIERAYQPKVLNPKTRAQMLQRASFASCVKLYKLLNNGLFKFAYEDKGQRESDYNAFMRHSLKYAYAANKVPTQRADIWPLECYLPVLSYGSLGELNIDPTSGDVFFSTTSPGWWLETYGTPEVEESTFGELSALLESHYGLQDGDFITFLVVVTDIPQSRSELIKLYCYADSAQLKPVYSHSMKIVQIQLDSSSTDTSKSVLEPKHIGFGGRETTSIGISIEASTVSESCCFASVFFSRKVVGGALKVSTSKLVPNVDEPDTIFADAERINTILSSWGASDEAILEGSLS